MPEPTQPPTSDPLALVLTRLSQAFTAVSALSDAVDVMPNDKAALLRPSCSAAFGSLSEAEDIAAELAVTS